MNFNQSEEWPNFLVSKHTRVQISVGGVIHAIKRKDKELVINYFQSETSHCEEGGSGYSAETAVSGCPQES